MPTVGSKVQKEKASIEEFRILMVRLMPRAPGSAHLWYFGQRPIRRYEWLKQVPTSSPSFDRRSFRAARRNLRGDHDGHSSRVDCTDTEYGPARSGNSSRRSPLVHGPANQSIGKAGSDDRADPGIRFANTFLRTARLDCR